MKLTLKIKLLPTDQQANLLLDTMKEANAVCNAISDIAWQDKIFNQFKIHSRCYYGIKSSFNLSSQVIIRCISKVTDSYKIDRKVKRTFRELGGITYDPRILTYKPNDIVSLWAIGGRIKIPFVCHNRNYLPYIKGEADLVYKKGKFYLFQTVEVPDEDIADIEKFIGVDFGLTTIAYTSDNVEFSADGLNKYREHRQKVRSSIQSKCTRNSRKLLKRLSGKERTHSSIVNHTIAKQIVQSAKSQNKGIAIEDLTGIRFTSKRRNKKFKTKLGKWNFNQLRAYITYKAQLNGVSLVVVPPAYTSQTCHSCNNIGKRTNKVFKCTNTNCKVDTIDADYNASKVISLLAGSINNPVKSTMFCSLHSLSGLKPIRSLVGG
jgi:IS605 OrfB family transposase